MAHGAPGEPGTLEGYGAQSAELAQLRTQNADLLAALKKTLEAFKNAMPKHLYRNECFNWETQPDPCPCTAHVVRRAIEAAEK